MSFDNMSDEKLIEKYIFKDDIELPCVVCKKPTKYVDISEARVCSQKCLDDFNDYLNSLND